MRLRRCERDSLHQAKVLYLKCNEITCSDSGKYNNLTKTIPFQVFRCCYHINQFVFTFPGSWPRQP
jgi:hypothetical protein